MSMNEYPLALVTGGALRLGREFALALARQGYAILLHYHQSSKAAVLVADEIRALGVPVYTVKADLTDPNNILSIFAVVDSVKYRLRVLINSAARMKRVDLKTLSIEDWDTTLDLNLRAPFLLAQRAAERMIDGGLIVNVTDAGAGKNWTGFPAYIISKNGLEVLTRLLAKTYAPTIRVNAIAPGLVLRSDEISSEEWMKLVDRLPLKRLPSIKDISKSLEFLLNNDSITGQTLVVDSGYSLL